MTENLKLSLIYRRANNKKHNNEKVTRGDKTRITSISNEDYLMLNEEVKNKELFK